MEKFTQKNIFAYNALKASTCKFDENYSHLHSLLLHLENQYSFSESSLEGFSKAVMDAINLSGAFFPIDRVCLTLTYPQGTRIRAVSVANSSRVGENIMPANYSCFVSKKSSVLKTETSNVRIFSDIDDIIAKYEEGKPVQRSLRLLKEMGLKSGITIPLPLSNAVSGFLFLNSVYQGTFDKLETEDYSTLCLLKMVATSVLQKCVLTKAPIDHTQFIPISEIKETTNSFSVDEFKINLNKVLSHQYEKNIEVGIKTSSITPVFFSIKPTLYLLTKAFELSGIFFQTDRLNMEMKLHQQEQEAFFELKIPDYKISDRQLQTLQSMKILTEYDVTVENGSLTCRSKAELVQNKNFDYSI